MDIRVGGDFAGNIQLRVFENREILRYHATVSIQACGLFMGIQLMLTHSQQIAFLSVQGCEKHASLFSL